MRRSCSGREPRGGQSGEGRARANQRPDAGCTRPARETTRRTARPAPREQGTGGQERKAGKPPRGGKSLDLALSVAGGFEQQSAVI